MVDERGSRSLFLQAHACVTVCVCLSDSVQGGGTGWIAVGWISRMRVLKCSKMAGTLGSICRITTGRTEQHTMMQYCPASSPTYQGMGSQTKAREAQLGRLLASLPSSYGVGEAHLYQVKWQRIA